MNEHLAGYNEKIEAREAAYWFPELTHVDADTAAIISVALQAARSAALVHQEHFLGRHAVSLKELNDIVTNVDLKAETTIRSLIATAFPQHAFASEESQPGSGTESYYRWVIDPLDGTVNYTAGIPFYSASVAAQRKGQTLVGVVHSSALDQVYVGVLGHGAYCNGVRLHVSDRSAINESVVSFMLTSHYTNEQHDDLLARVRSLSPRTRGVRLYVSQALELAYIAAGRLDGHVCIKSRGFSGAAGVLILREAGGCATDLQGNPFSNESRSIVASNTHLHTAIIDVVRTSNA